MSRRSVLPLGQPGDDVLALVQPVPHQTLPVATPAANNVTELYPKSDREWAWTDSSGTERILGSEPYVDGADYLVGDGTTDDWNNLKTAVQAASGNLLYIPAGTYRLVIPSGDEINPATGTTLAGAGPGTVLLCQPTVLTNLRLFGTQFGDITFRDLTIRGDYPANASGYTFRITGDDVRIVRVRIDGGHTAAHQHTVHALKLGDTDSARLLVDDCQIINSRWGLLKANPDTTTNTDIVLRRCYFRDNYGNHIGFNSPRGLIANVLVEGCSFAANRGAFGAQLGMASAKRVRVIGNAFEDVCKEGIHVEEAVEHIVITGNTFSLTEADAIGIRVLDNNVGGANVMPQHVVISGNALHGGGRTGSGIGIQLVNDGGDPPARYIVITDNVIDDFATGILAADDAADSPEVRENVIHNCATGLFLPRATASVRDNQVLDCGTGVQATLGGLLGAQRLDGNATPLRVGTGRLSMLGWSNDQRVDLPASGASEVPLLTLGARASGTLRLVYHHSGTAYRHTQRNIAWDGTTLTDAAAFNDGIGQVALSGVIAAGGVLTVRLFNSGVVLNGGRLEAVFDGLWVA